MFEIKLKVEKLEVKTYDMMSGGLGLSSGRGGDSRSIDPPTGPELSTADSSLQY